jgi:hypothetical protein
MMRLAVLLLAVVAVPLQFCGELGAQPPGSRREPVRQNAVPKPSDFFVGVEVSHKTHQYREGDTISVRVVSEVDAYVHVLYRQADGREFQIFPNSRQRNNLLRAREAVQIPAADDDFRWHIGPPFGDERVKVIASRQPIRSLSAKELSEERFNPVSTEYLKGVAQELGEERAPASTTVETPITTFPRNAQLEAGGARRFGVFFGVADYKFSTAVESATGRGNNLATCHRDARKLRELMRERGQLNDAREFTNEEATTANFKQAVTGWLPSVSRPGDTVFIYFSGHGGVANIDSRSTHFLVPYDFISPKALDGLRKMRANRQLNDSRLVRALQEVENVLSTYGEEEGLRRIVRDSLVTDEQFGHWIQALDGRQVVVILDICYASGFATHAEQKEIDDNPKEFRFLQDQMVRLKDIGQPESALLAASRANETSAVRSEEDLSVMTFELIRAVESGPPPLTLRQAFNDVSAGMTRYFATHPRSTAHQPMLYDYCSRPIYLKP